MRVKMLRWWMVKAARTSETSVDNYFTRREWRREPSAIQLHHHPDDGGSTHLWNVGILRDYTEIYPRKFSSSR
jgi:hypothetical protein